MHLKCTNSVHPMRSRNSTSFTMLSPRSSDILWEAVKVARLLAGLGEVDGTGCVVAGTLSVGGGWTFGVDGDAC